MLFTIDVHQPIRAALRRQLDALPRMTDGAKDAAAAYLAGRLDHLKARGPGIFMETAWGVRMLIQITGPPWVFTVEAIRLDDPDREEDPHAVYRAGRALLAAWQPRSCSLDQCQMAGTHNLQVSFRAGEERNRIDLRVFPWGYLVTDYLHATADYAAGVNEVIGVARDLYRIYSGGHTLGLTHRVDTVLPHAPFLGSKTTPVRAFIFGFPDHVKTHADRIIVDGGGILPDWAHSIVRARRINARGAEAKFRSAAAEHQRLWIDLPANDSDEG